MLRRIITRLLTSVALLCASGAWNGWLFLHSFGDPHRAERIATAILDDPSARDEIAGPIASQLVNNLSVDAATERTIRDTIADALSDRAVVGNFIAAFGSATSNALGVDDARPTTIDTAALTAAVRARLAVTSPEIAAMIPTTSTQIELPVVRTTAARDLRALAQRWTGLLTITAASMLGASLLLGHRRTVIRAYGFWAIATGALWAIGPRLLPWLAHTLSPDTDALIGASVRAMAGPITTAASILAGSGLVALVVRYAVLGSGEAHAPSVAMLPSAGAAIFGDGVVLHGDATAAHEHGPADTTWVAALARTGQIPVQPAHPLPPLTRAEQDEIDFQATLAAVVHRSNATSDHPTATQIAAGWTPGPLLLRPLDVPGERDSLSTLAGDDRELLS